MKNMDFVYKHPNTVWESIRNQLLMDILNNVHKAGERVPSTNELARQYNVSINTAGKALEYLKEEDIIMKKRGIGFFVVPYARTKVAKLLKDDFNQKLIDILKLAKILGYGQDEVKSTISSIWGGS